MTDLEKMQNAIESGVNQHLQLMIGAAEAEYLLANNPDNRRLNLPDVEKYARQMKNGTFVDNGDTIAVSEEGYLNNGQHRLQAIIRSGCTVPMWIAFGLSRSSRDTVDQALSRTANHVLNMRGAYPYCNTQAAMANALLHYEAPGSDGRISNHKLKFSVAEKISRIDRDQKILRAIEEMQRHQDGMKEYASLTVISLAYYFIMDRPGGLAYMSQVVSGIGTTPIAALVRAKLLRMGKSKLEQKVWVIIRGYIATQNSETLSMIYVPKKIRIRLP